MNFIELQKWAVLASQVGINQGKVKELVKGILDPAISIGLWLVPLLSIAVCIYTFANWLLKDEDEKERHKPFRLIKKIIAGTVFIELIQVIYAIFNLA